MNKILITLGVLLFGVTVAEGRDTVPHCQEEMKKCIDEMKKVGWVTAAIPRACKRLGSDDDCRLYLKKGDCRQAANRCNNHSANPETGRFAGCAYLSAHYHSKTKTGKCAPSEANVNS